MVMLGTFAEPLANRCERKISVPQAAISPKARRQHERRAQQHHFNCIHEA